MKEVKEPGKKIKFINILKYIESGESGNITIKGKKYDIYVNKENGFYYINDEGFKGREEFIEAIYTKTSVKLKENTIIILNSIADGKIKIDSSWKFEDENENENENQVNVNTKKKYKLRRNMIIALLLWYFIAIFLIYTCFKELKYTEDIDSLVLITKNEFWNRIYIYFSSKFTAILIVISVSFIFFIEDNRRRIKMLLKYSSEDMKNIEDRVSEYIYENVRFGEGFDEIAFLEEGMFLKRKTNLRVIDYKDIKYVVNIQYKKRKYNKNKRILIITKNKKAILLEDIIYKEKFVKEISNRNPEIIYKEFKKENYKKSISAEEVKEINKAIFKVTVNNYIRLIVKVNVLYLFLLYIFNFRLVLKTNKYDSYITSKAIDFILGIYLVGWIGIIVMYLDSKIKNKGKKR